MSNNPLVWTDERCEELADFAALLEMASSINSANNCLERISKCIEIADKLRYGDFGSGRPSFYRFLCNLAIDNRTEFKGE